MPKEDRFIRILSLLASNSDGLFGSTLVSMDKNTLSMGRVYNDLAELKDSGFVRSEKCVSKLTPTMSRLRWFITDEGRRARTKFISEKA